MKKLITSMIIAAASIANGGIAMAASAVQLSSDIFVEKTVKHKNGSIATVLEEPTMVVPGDHLVFVVEYKNNGASAAEKFVVTNPMPRAVAFNGTSDGSEIVSVDGGKNWGALSQLKVTNADAESRPALMSDVTHIRWQLNKPLASGSVGKLVFRGIVR